MYLLAMLVVVLAATERKKLEDQVLQLYKDGYNSDVSPPTGRSLGYFNTVH